MIYVSDSFISKPIVSVFIFTYNQEQYISQTIDSILKQKTQYSYEIVLVDDFSIDKTPEICLKYQKNNPKIIKFIANKSNKGLIRSYHESILDYCKGKYIAQCAGDDYWDSDDKLEKQVSILETDYTIGVVHTQIIILKIKSSSLVVSNKNRNKTGFNDLLFHNCISAPTVCFRKDMYFNYLKEINPIKKKWVVEDTPMWLWFSIHSKIYFLNETTVVYRIIAGSISNTNSSRKYFDFIKSRLSIKLFFIKKYGASAEILQFVYNDFYKDAEYHVLKIKDKKRIKNIIKWHKKNKNLLKLFYINLMYLSLNNKITYYLLFFLYRLFYKTIRIFKKND